MVALRDRPPKDTLDFDVFTVTGQSLEVTNVQRSTPTRDVASVMAERFGLPTDVPWGLRSKTRILREDLPISTQVTTGEQLTIHPRAHLGA